MLLLSILCSSLVFIVFRWFDKAGVDNLSAITLNYFIASFLGGYLSQDESLERLTFANGLPFLFIGVLFIVMFVIMARVSQSHGAGATSVYVKLSVLLPVLFGLIYFQEALGLLKVAGIVFALMAILLTGGFSLANGINSFRGPMLLFLGTGTIDVLMSYVMHLGWEDSDVPLISSILFGIAGITGLMYALVTNRMNKLFSRKNLLGGLILGIPNFGTVYFLLRAMKSPGMESSILFPLNNTGIILLTTLLGMVLFKERLTTKSSVGLILAIASIILLQFTF